MDAPPSSSSGDSGEDVETLASTAECPSGIDLNIKETISLIRPDGQRSSVAVEPDTEAATPPIMASRAYQLEMLDQSLKRNVIVAVCVEIYGNGLVVNDYRWIQEVERPKCKSLFWKQVVNVDVNLTSAEPYFVSRLS